MAYFPKLDPTATRVLETLLERSNLSGFDLMHQLSTNVTDLMGAIASLRKEELVQVSGDVSNEKTFPFANFAVRPSAKEFAHLLAKQNQS